MSEILTPEALEHEVGLLVDELRKLVSEYRWGYGVAFSPQVVETVNVTTSDESNVPLALATQKQKLRGQLRAACSMIRQQRMGRRRRDGTTIVPGVEQQVDYITSALEVSEARHGVQFDEVRNPRSLAADGSELRELQAAQRRRQKRGESA